MEAKHGEAPLVKGEIEFFSLLLESFVTCMLPVSGFPFLFFFCVLLLLSIVDTWSSMLAGDFLFDCVNGGGVYIGFG